MAQVETGGRWGGTVGLDPIKLRHSQKGGGICKKSTVRKGQYQWGSFGSSKKAFCRYGKKIEGWGGSEAYRLGERCWKIDLSGGLKPSGENEAPKKEGDGVRKNDSMQKR